MEGGDGVKWKRRKIGLSMSMNCLRMMGGFWGGLCKILYVFFLIFKCILFDILCGS